MEKRLARYLSEVAIEKGAFGLHSVKVCNFTLHTKEEKYLQINFSKDIWLY